MALVTVVLLAAITTMHFAIHGAEVQVPDLKGMTVPDARSETAGLGLSLDVDNRYYSGDVATGHILSQSPEPGTVVRREWKVRVAESLGPQKVELGTTARLAYAGAAERTVLAQDPPAHAQGISRPSINLLVAGPNDDVPDGYVMPDLVGLLVESAQAQLTRVGIKSTTSLVDVAVPPVASSDAPPRMPVKPGAVLTQTPMAGSRVDQGTLVKLTVAK